MRSDKDSLVDGLEAIEAGYRAISVFPLETLSRSEGHALLARLDKLNQELVLLHRRVNGRLLTMSRDQRASA
jgi:hypothetical protein